MTSSRSSCVSTSSRLRMVRIEASLRCVTAVRRRADAVSTGAPLGERYPLKWVFLPHQAAPYSQQRRKIPQPALQRPELRRVLILAMYGIFHRRRLFPPGGPLGLGGSRLHSSFGNHLRWGAICTFSRQIGRSLFLTVAILTGRRSGRLIRIGRGARGRAVILGGSSSDASVSINSRGGSEPSKVASPSG